MKITVLMIALGIRRRVAEGTRAGTNKNLENLVGRNSLFWQERSRLGDVGAEEVSFRVPLLTFAILPLLQQVNDLDLASSRSCRRTFSN